MRSIPRTVKTTVVLAIVLMMTIDTANACRLLKLLSRDSGSCDCSCEVSAPVASAPIVAAPMVIESAPVVQSFPIVESLPMASAPIIESAPVYGEPVVIAGPNCCCSPVVQAAPIMGGTIVQSGPIDDGYVESGFAVEAVVDGEFVDYLVPTDPQPIQETMPLEIIPESTVVESYEVVPESTTKTPWHAAPIEIPAAPVVTDNEVPADLVPVVDEPAEVATDDSPVGTDLFDDAVPETVVDLTEDDTEMSDNQETDEFEFADDLETTSEPPVAETPPTEDALAEPEPEPEPAVETEDELGGARDDAFSDVTDESSDLFEDAGDESSDLFDDAGEVPAAPDEGGDLFDEGDAEPVDIFDGGEEPSDNEVDDIFSSSEPDQTFTASDPENELPGTSDASEPTEADDLFAETTDEPAVTDDAADIDVPAATEEGQGDEIDFDSDSEFDVEGLDELPVDDSADEVDDIFSQKQLPKGMRVWTDDTGKHQTIGRLVVIARSKIRLLKANGRHATVPLTRLSNKDVQYVMLVANRIAESKQIASL